MTTTKTYEYTIEDLASFFKRPGLTSMEMSKPMEPTEWGPSDVWPAPEGIRTNPWRFGNPPNPFFGGGVTDPALIEKLMGMGIMGEADKTSVLKRKEKELTARNEALQEENRALREENIDLQKRNKGLEEALVLLTKTQGDSNE